MLIVERLFVTLVGGFFGYLGFKLFRLGIDGGHATVRGEGGFGKWFFSGTGPGLFFMLVGGVVIVAALMTGSAEADETLGRPAWPKTAGPQAPAAPSQLNPASPAEPVAPPSGAPVPEPETHRRRKISENDKAPPIYHDGVSPQPTAIFSSISAAMTSPGSIHVSWKYAGDEITSFAVYRWVGSDWSKIAVLGATVTSYTDTGLHPSTTYVYSVCAQRGTTASCADRYVTASTSAAISPATPPDPGGERTDCGTATTTTSRDTCWRPGVAGTLNADDVKKTPPAPPPDQWRE
jgi:hypothetical protein